MSSQELGRASLPSYLGDPYAVLDESGKYKSPRPGTRAGNGGVRPSPDRHDLDELGDELRLKRLGIKLRLDDACLDGLLLRSQRPIR